MRLRTIDTNGVRLRVAEAGQGPLVVLLHGFPESWYSWRHQIPALAEAGYHVIAPDQRGYGGSDAPQAIEEYDIHHLTGDVVGLLDALGEKSAVVVGHDWGAPVAWHCALLHRDRFHGVAALSVPYTGRLPIPPLQAFQLLAGESFFYILYFQEPGVAERELDADPRDTLVRLLYAASGDAPDLGSLLQKPKGSRFLDGMPRPERLPPWLREEDLEAFVADFRRTGFRGGLNWYRNFDRNWETTPELDGAKVEQPALFIAGERDAVVRMIDPETMRPWVPNLRDLVMLPGCGHWTQQERPNEVNAALLGFLRSL